MKIVSEERMKMMQERLIQEHNRKEMVKKDMIENTNYIDWLIEFTKEHPVFSDEDWLYNEENISKEDLEKVRNLPLLFECIYSYANRNYISSNLDEWGESFSINKDDVYMNIGYNTGQGTIFYCERTDKQENSIYFYSIMNPNTSMRTMHIEHCLEQISDDIRELLVTFKVPVEYIHEMVSNAEKETDIEKQYTKK